VYAIVYARSRLISVNALELIPVNAVELISVKLPRIFSARSADSESPSYLYPSCVTAAACQHHEYSLIRSSHLILFSTSLSRQKKSWSSDLLVITFYQITTPSGTLNNGIIDAGALVPYVGIFVH